VVDRASCRRLPTCATSGTVGQGKRIAPCGLVPPHQVIPILIEGAVLSAALSTVIVASVLYNPRLWINDAPPRVRELAPPLTAVERRARSITGTLLLLTFAVVTIWSAVRLLARYGETLSIATAFWHFLGVFFLFNLFDLVVIDWLVLLVLRPRALTRLSVPGLTHEETVGSFAYHFRGFVIGLGIITVGGLMAALLTYLAKLGQF